jgi:haloacid dehalogenase superfamily, subfamily IA, variant 3 with third motif having DD or ED/haloacid dehalogenase superfamily, subfamily IA, variant 1 with third motif having Dx(3-4)D or Dx(3-4)E
LNYFNLEHIIKPMDIKLVIFDLDGTVVENNYDWALIRKTLGVEGGSILSYLDRLPETEKKMKYAQLEEFERQQTRAARLKPGIQEFLAYLKSAGLSTALVTNNNRENTEYLLQKFKLKFDLVITRESGLYKPTGEPFKEVMSRLGVEPEQTVVIGDTHYDLLAAEQAGIARVFILKSDMTPDHLAKAVLVNSFAEIKAQLDKIIGSQPEIC